VEHQSNNDFPGRFVILILAKPFLRTGDMFKAFTQHPASVGETYLGHMATAFGFAATLAVASACCALHAIFPFAFKTAGSRRIRELYQRMVTHRAPQRAQPAPTDDYAAGAYI
jgi:hypothetical protein